MTKDILPEIVSAVVFCAIAIAIINPMNLWMPSMAHMTMLALGAVAFGAFAIFAVREVAGDERDDAHRAFSGRMAFLAGSAVLLLGIALQSKGHVDPWLVYALIAMVVGKTAARMWSRLYR